MERRQAGHGVAGHAGVAAAAVVHRHMQCEVTGVDAQFVEFIGRDQQVQGQLLIGQVTG